MGDEYGHADLRFTRTAHSTSGRNISHLTPVNRSMLGQYSAGTRPRAYHIETMLLPLFKERANLLAPPAMATASFNPFMRHLITNVGDLSSANVINISRKISSVETLAERLKRLRKAIKLSQAKLAQKAGVSQSAIGMIESGERENPQILVQLAAALGVSVEMLATGKGLEQQRVVMTDQEAELIGQWAFLSPAQKIDVHRIIRQYIDQNREVLAAFGGRQRKPEREQQITDPTLPEFNELTDFSDQRDHDRRTVQKAIDSDRRLLERRNK